MRRLHALRVTLVACTALTFAGSLTQRPALFGVGYGLTAICLVALSRSGSRASRRVLDTPDMTRVVSDVREGDRALRDGTWLTEFGMLDDGPRRIIGSVAVVLMVLILATPAFYMIGAFSAQAPWLTGAAIVLGTYVVGYVASL